MATRPGASHAAAAWPIRSRFEEEAGSDIRLSRHPTSHSSRRPPGEATGQDCSPSSPRCLCPSAKPEKSAPKPSNPRGTQPRPAEAMDCGSHALAPSVRRQWTSHVRRGMPSAQPSLPQRLRLVPRLRGPCPPLRWIDQLALSSGGPCAGRDGIGGPMVLEHASEDPRHAPGLLYACTSQ